MYTNSLHFTTLSNIFYVKWEQQRKKRKKKRKRSSQPLVNSWQRFSFSCVLLSWGGTVLLMSLWTLRNNSVIFSIVRWTDDNCFKNEWALCDSVYQTSLIAIQSPAVLVSGHRHVDGLTVVVFMGKLTTWQSLVCWWLANWRHDNILCVIDWPTVDMSIFGVLLTGQLTTSQSLVCYRRHDNIGVLVTGHSISSNWSSRHNSPGYNRIGWLDVKYQVIYRGITAVVQVVRSRSLSKIGLIKLLWHAP